MAVQGIWSGTVSFSLVAIPVRLVKAVEPGRVSFHLLHGSDYARLNRRLFCPEEHTPVPPEEIVRGFEIAPDSYVLMTDEELDAVSPERSRTIEITEFIDLHEVDPLYFDHPYYLVPAKGGEKAYQLLVEVLRRTNRAGLAKFVLAEREYLVAVSSREGALALTTLHYADEILAGAGPAPEHAAADPGTKNALEAAITGMTADFDPGKYADARRKKLRDFIAAKAGGNAIVEAPAVAAGEETGPPDLVAALEESMRKVKEGA